MIYQCVKWRGHPVYYWWQENVVHKATNPYKFVIIKRNLMHSVTNILVFFLHAYKYRCTLTCDHTLKNWFCVREIYNMWIVFLSEKLRLVIVKDWRDVMGDQKRFPPLMPSVWTLGSVKKGLLQTCIDVTNWMCKHQHLFV